jgi:ABC-type multidrug transport system fused ATPase/permease subunit
MFVYFAFGVTSLVLQVGRAVILVFATIRAATKMHNDLLHKVIRLPMSFFDTQPTGRLLNRFTKDVEACDLSLQQTCSSFTSCATSVIFSIIVVIAVTRGTIALALLPLFFLYKSIQQYYLKTSRELKRLDSIAFSPIFSHFGETLSGLMTVRAFRRQPIFADKNETLLDRSNRCYWPIQVRVVFWIATCAGALFWA